jgi:Tol biopolymer transport system component
VVAYLILQPGRNASAPIQGEFAQLTTLAGEELFPSLSPDGEYLVYASEASGNWDIYLLRVGGEKPLNLTEDSPEDDTQPAFSRDGKQIAFRSERQGGGIFVMGATGESVRRLTEIGYNPAWSPDGEKIVYAREESVATNPLSRIFIPNQLWAVNVSTGAEWLIAESDAVQPSWSPHSSRIAYWAVRDFRKPEVAGKGQRDIWTIAASGGKPLRVTNDPWLDWNPVWSHDGKHLYFSSDRGGTLNLWQVPIDEVSGEVLGEPEAVTTPSTWVGHMSISRDGRRIVYTSRVSLKNLYKIAFDPVTESVVGQQIPVLEDSRQPNRVDLSSDGRLLVFQLKGENEDIVVIGSDGTGFRKLTDDPHRDRCPRWSPDGEQITFYSNRTGIYQVWSIHPDGSGLRQLTDSPDGIYYSTWSPDGTRVFSNIRIPGNSQVKGILWNPNKPWHEQQPEMLPLLTSDSGSEQWVGALRADWSPDGQTIAGPLIGQSPNIALYDLDTQRHRFVTDFGSASDIWADTLRWLNDGQRLLFLVGSRGTLHLLDTETKEQKEILSLDRNYISDICLSKSNDFIYFISGRSEADIWMLTLDEER